MRIVVPPGVFRPRSDTWLLAQAIHAEACVPGASVLDVCTGSGALAVAAARAGAREVTAVDVSRRAVLAARLNARLNGVRLRALRGDLFAPVGSSRFDVIVSNPPYLPGSRDHLPRRGPARAWEAGSDGRALLDRIAAGAPAILSPGGVLLLVQSSVAGVAQTLERLHAAGLVETRVTARTRGPLGPLLSARAEALEERGILRAGEREEELVAIRARRPGRMSPARAQGRVLRRPSREDPAAIDRHSPPERRDDPLPKARQDDGTNWLALSEPRPAPR